MENIKELIQLYEENFMKLQKITKEQTEEEKKVKDITTYKSELFYQLEDKKLAGDEYLEKIKEQNKKQEKRKQKNEILLIEKKLLQDNENIIIDKIIIDIFKNILLKYNNKNVGEKTVKKIDEEIKKYIQPLYDEKYIYIYEYNTYTQQQPNQFINIFTSDYSFNNYDKKMLININSKYNENRNDYKQKIYIKNSCFLLNEYSKAEEIEQDNQAIIERIEQTKIVEDTKTKAKEIYKGYEKKKKTLENLKKQEEKEKNAFNELIKNNQNMYYHNLFNYFYR